jgi:hypothetical protein
VRRLVRSLQVSTIFNHVQHLEISALCLEEIDKRDNFEVHYNRIPSLALLCKPRSICFHLQRWSLFGVIPCVTDIVEACPEVERVCVHLDSRCFYSYIVDLVLLRAPVVEMVDVSREETGAADIVGSFLDKLESRSEFRAKSAIRLLFSFPNMEARSLPLLLRAGARTRTSSQTQYQQAAIDGALARIAENPDVDSVALYNVKIVVGHQARCSRGSVGWLLPTARVTADSPSSVNIGSSRHRERSGPCS